MLPSKITIKSKSNTLLSIIFETLDIEYQYLYEFILSYTAHTGICGHSKKIVTSFQSVCGEIILSPLLVNSVPPQLVLPFLPIYK